MKATAALEAYRRRGAELEAQGRYGGAHDAYASARGAANALGRWEDALICSQKAVEMAERAYGVRVLAPSLGALAWAYIRVKNPNAAIPHFQRAARTARQWGWLEFEAQLYADLSRAYRDTDRLSDALDALTKSASILEGLPRTTFAQRSRVTRAEGVLYKEFGHTYLRMRSWEKARLAYEKALQTAQTDQRTDTIAEAHGGLGDVARQQGLYDEAAARYEVALRVYPSRPGLAVWRQALGDAYLRQGRLAEAEATLRQAVAVIEEMRTGFSVEESREAYFAHQTGAYTLLVETLVQRGDVTQAFNVAERGRARAFLDLLGNRVTLSRDRTAALVAEERQLQDRINRLKALPEDSPAGQREIQAAREAYQAFLQRVRKLDREQASLMAVEPLTLDQVQAMLPPGTALIEYFVSDERIDTWRVERDAVRMETLRLPSNVLNQSIQGFRAALQTPGTLTEVHAQAQDLYRQLLAPLLGDHTPKELIIVPHGALHYLPFHALMPAPDRYLLQEMPISYYSSASLMQFTREKRARDTAGVLAAGSPSLADPRLNLRYARREVLGIGDLYPGAIVLTAAAATKPAVRAHIQNQRLLHFATHADLDEADPLGSALLFTPTDGDNGRLDVQEIFGLTLQADLVVLSACETSLGNLKRGDELTGLTRAFIYAGTPSIITTLWQVNDRASYQLMLAFHQHLKAGQGKGEALRQAQLTTMTAYVHPYYWAAYQLTGEAR